RLPKRTFMSTLASNRDSGVLHLTLNRPAKRNALNADLCRELVEGFEAAEADPDVHVILLTAVGPSFCAGMDLSDALSPPRPAATIARQIASANPVAIRKGLAAIHQSRSMNWKDAGDLARTARKEVFASPRYREALQKFQRRES